jgi:3-dehydroquinate synthetase
MASQRITVTTASRTYDVVVGSGTLASLGELTLAALGSTPGRVVIVHDRALPASLVEAATATLASRVARVEVIPIVATEATKSLATLGTILEAMAAARLERTDPVIALGGGITGDVAGFAAATYRRGVPVVQCPTTLLSMVDAAVGGKTGVNLLMHASPDAQADATPDSPRKDSPRKDSLKKNLVGAFHQPSLVLIDTLLLGSLAPRHFRSGLAECIKHAMIAGEVGDDGLLDWTDASMAKIHALDPATIVELVVRSVRLKAAIVAGDEREELTSDKGGRALLNLGHTFGHALEALRELSPSDNDVEAPLQHGEAVALGLVAATATSVALGLLPVGALARVKRLVEAARLPTRVRGLPIAEALVALMGDDKKVRGGKLRLILPTEHSRAVVVTDPPIAAVHAGWSAIRA